MLAIEGRMKRMQIKNLMIRPVVSIVLLMMVTFFCQPILVEGASVVYTEKDIYNQGEMIGVHFTNAPGYDSDWICVVPAGSPDTDAGNYKYMPRGLGEGLLLFDPLSPGEYEVRAYYDYRRNGYVVSGRYAFSVGSDLSDLIEANLPPPIPFAAPPEMVVIPETYVYVAPDIDVDLFFWGGWWWRPWGGRWYRSHYYNRDWGYYNNVPSFYFDVDPGWRGYYRDRNWYGHRWDYERIPNQRLQQNWKSWQNDRRWERRGTWGVQNYRSQSQKQRQELRQQRQQQYQQRPDVQQHQQQRQRQPQVQQPRQQPQKRVQQPQRQEQRPQVQQPEHAQPRGKPEREEGERRR